MHTRTDTVLAVDPGHEQSAFALMQRNINDVPVIRAHGLVENAAMLPLLSNYSFDGYTLALEQIQGMGMAVGREVFETCVWSGRFIQVWVPAQYVRIPRRWVKQHLCGQDRAKDQNVRVAIMDRFGGAGAKGTKGEPGPLYGVKADVWAAVAVGLTYLESSDRFDENGKVE